MATMPGWKLSQEGTYLNQEISELKEQIDYTNKKHNIDQNWNIEQIHNIKEVLRELIKALQITEYAISLSYGNKLLAKLGKEGS